MFLIRLVGELDHGGAMIIALPFGGEEGKGDFATYFLTKLAIDDHAKTFNLENLFIKMGNFSEGIPETS